jgi:hypothetical protein
MSACGTKLSFGRVNTQVVTDRSCKRNAVLCHSPLGGHEALLTDIGETDKEARVLIRSSLPV